MAVVVQWRFVMAHKHFSVKRVIAASAAGKRSADNEPSRIGWIVRGFVPGLMTRLLAQTLRLAHLTIAALER